MRNCRTLIVNHMAGDVSAENSRIKQVLVRGGERKSPEGGTEPSHGVTFPVAQRFCCLLSQRSCHSVLRSQLLSTAFSSLSPEGDKLDPFSLPHPPFSFTTILNKEIRGGTFSDKWLRESKVTGLSN